jgi:hypothetical protein
MQNWIAVQFVRHQDGKILRGRSLCGYDEESYSPAALQDQKEVF